MPEPLPILSEFTPTTPDVLAEHWGVSKRTLRRDIRKIGAFIEVGNRMLLFPQHVARLIASYQEDDALDEKNDALDDE
jgi:DeoR/GlpR family transcriptional regulator of sugar metabolism